MRAWPIRIESDDAGVFQRMRVVRGDENLLLKRMESFNGFVCDNETDVLALLNSRAKIEKITCQAGHVSDEVISRELEALYSDVVEASKIVAEPEAEKVHSWANG
jgi:transcription elongation factor Elf1